MLPTRTDVIHLDCYAMQSGTQESYIFMHIIVFIINTFTGNDQIIVIPCKCIDFTELETANGIETMYKIL